jgi:AraC-like DNA-binding protein
MPATKGQLNAPMGPTASSMGGAVRAPCLRAANQASASEGAAGPGILDVDIDQLLLVVPKQGATLTVLESGVVHLLTVGSAALVAHPGQVRIQPDMGAVRLRWLDRRRFQRWVTAHYREPRRLQASIILFDPRGPGVAKEIDGLGAGAPCQAAGGLQEDRLCQAVIEAIDAADANGEAWSVYRPLKRALDYILANLGADCSREVVAGAAGMTTKTLERQAAAYFGSSLATFVADLRLTAAFQALASARDSRPVEVVAGRYGFSSASAFARAYRRRFGESPTATRVRAVKHLGILFED